MNELQFLHAIRQFRAVERATGRNYSTQVRLMAEKRIEALAAERGVEPTEVQLEVYRTVYRETRVDLGIPKADL